jgi:hypothetical protein
MRSRLCLTFRNANFHEKGNALFLILIAVALFAALAYAVTQSGRGGSSSTQKEMNTLAAAKIVQSAGDMARVIMRMKLIDNVNDERFCFDSPLWPAAETNYYDNQSGCANGLNKVFDPSGGGVDLPRVESSWFDPVYPPSATLLWDWVFTGVAVIENVGTAAPDLVMFLAPLRKEICEEINRQLGLPVPVPDDYVESVWAFQFGFDDGSAPSNYVHTQTIGRDDATITALAGQFSGCGHDGVSAGESKYYFYHVLLAR